MNKIYKPTGTYTCMACLKQFTNLSAARKHRNKHFEDELDSLGESLDTNDLEGTGILYKLKYPCLEFWPPEKDLEFGEAIFFLNDTMEQIQQAQKFRSSELNGDAIMPYIYKRNTPPRLMQGMYVVGCIIEGCSGTFKTDEPIFSSARFVCKKHNREQQAMAIGRIYAPATSDTEGGPVNAGDHDDDNAKFQDSQFSHDLRRSKKPEGTTHIKRQGSDTTTAEDVNLSREEKYEQP